LLEWETQAPRKRRHHRAAEDDEPRPESTRQAATQKSAQKSDLAGNPRWWKPKYPIAADTAAGNDERRKLHGEHGDDDHQSSKTDASPLHRLLLEDDAFQLAARCLG
jgi:hypothetical protein